MVKTSKKFIAIFIVGASAVAVFFYTPIVNFVENLRSNDEQDKEQSPKILIGDKKIKLEIADTILKRAQGLSGRKKMAPDTGMLFIFDNPGYYSFWMKNMYMNIDIVWLDENWQVIDITPNLSPKTFPHSYYPKAPVKYVLEIPAGMAGKWGITGGDNLNLRY